MRVLILSGLVLLITCCNRHSCPATAEINKDLFRKHLATIHESEAGRGKVFVDDYRAAINFLSLVTGIDSKADYSSTFGYRNKTDYKSDMKQWQKWYKKNQCKLTEQYIDSAFKSVGLERQTANN